MKNALGSTLILFLSVLLQGCTGGSSGGGGGGSIPLPTAPVTITQQNAPQVAGAAFDAVSGGTSLPVISKSSIPAKAQSKIYVARTVSGISQSVVQKIISQSTSSPINAADISYCTYGGTLTVEATGPTSGIGTYNKCSMEVGETMNGTIYINNIEFTATTLSFSSVVDLSITKVSPANTLRAIGDMSIAMDISTDAMTMSGTSLAMGNSNVALGNYGLQNYRIVSDSAGTIKEMTYTFASTLINGTGQFAMTAPFSSTNFASFFPSAGAAIITGANSTMLRLNVLGDENAVGNQVQLELSVDGGATYALPTYHTWAEISSLL